MDNHTAPEPLTDGEAMAFANLIIALKEQPAFIAEYKNWRGETSERCIEPLRIWYGSTEYHPEPCLLLKGRDIDRDVERDFKIADFDLTTMRRL